MTGEWPPNQIDHIDRNPSNNQFDNLRLATGTENNRNRAKFRNNKSGLKGVSWSSHAEKWTVRICVDYRQMHLGYFDTKEAAHEAYQQAAREYHGKFAAI